MTVIKLYAAKGPAQLPRLVGCILLSCVLAIADHRYGYVPALRASLSTLVYPMQVIVNLPMLLGDRLAEELQSREAIIQENQRLKTENLLLRTQSQRFMALETENMRLRELLDSSLKAGDRILVADLIAAPAGPDIRQITLNKGSQNGLYLGQPVLDAQGVMGQIIHVSPFTSTAMLLSDPTHALPVQINRSGVRAVAIGTGEEKRLQLSYVPNNADVRKGDLVVSSGVGGHFPGGYPVGEVVDVTFRPGEPFALVTVAPKANLAYSNEVLLVWPGQGPVEIARITANQHPNE